MKSGEKCLTPHRGLLIALLLICAVVVGYFTVQHYLLVPLGPSDTAVNERLQINSVAAYPAPQPHLALNVTGIRGQTENSPITITELLVKTNSGALVQSINLKDSPITVPTDGSQTTFQVNMTSPLTSQTKYCVALVVDSGSSFISSDFIGP